MINQNKQNSDSVSCLERKTSVAFEMEAGEKHFSVRRLVHRIEARASDRFERLSGRFSSTAKRSRQSKKNAKAEDESSCTSTTAVAATATSTVKGLQPLSATKTRWYLPSGDKITTDSNDNDSNDERIPITDETLEVIPFPDVSDVCDCYNEFIYLRLTQDKADFLNSYDSDFEEEYDEVPAAEASNTIISLRLSIECVQHGIFGCKSVNSLDAEPSPENDDGFSESDDSVFYDAEDSLSVSPLIENVDRVEAGGSCSDLDRPNEVKRKVSQLSYQVEELLETERNYINVLDKGITTYIKNVFHAVPISPELVNMKYHLFGNIEYIHQFHKSILLPKLTSCGKDIAKVAEVFSQYLQNDSFYGYVLYSLYSPKSQRLCEQFARFFENHQTCSGDKLGVKSFILQPIQRLPRYKLMLSNIAKSLRSSGSDDDLRVLNVILNTEQLLQSFINTMNESMEVNDITECERIEDNEVELGFGVPKPATVLREQNSENQFLFVYPRECENSDRCKPINILHQGKFKKVFPVFFNDLRQGRQYPGKLFIFERCVIYTEQLKLKTLSYRGHFDHHEVSYDFSNLLILKIVSEQDEHHSIEVKINIQSPSSTSLVAIVESLRSIVATRKKKDAFVIESTELAIIRNRIMNRYNSCRSSFSSVSSSFSFYNTCGPNQIEDTSSLDCSSPTVDVAEETALDSILTYLQYYFKALKDSINFYIYSFPSDLCQQLVELNEKFQDMLKIQNNLYFRLFDESQTADLNLSYLCDAFHDSLKQSEFDVYLNYVKQFKSAEAMLMSFEQYFTGLPKESDTIILSIDAFLFLPVEYVNKCYEFFKGVWADTRDIREEVILRNLVLDYKINYIHSQLSLLRQRLNENFYIRHMIMDVDFLNEIELVQYSEIVKLEGSYATYRLFLMKTGLLCMKINSDRPGKAESYSSLTFYCPYNKTMAKMSHRSGKRWSVFLDGRKTVLIVGDKQKRHVLHDHYCKLADQMRTKDRVRKLTFFRSSEH